jgi:hypothetical protein
VNGSVKLRGFAGVSGGRLSGFGRWAQRRGRVFSLVRQVSVKGWSGKFLVAGFFLYTLSYRDPLGGVVGKKTDDEKLSSLVFFSSLTLELI